MTGGDLTTPDQIATESELSRRLGRDRNMSRPEHGSLRGKHREMNIFVMGLVFDTTLSGAESRDS